MISLYLITLRHGYHLFFLYLWAFIVPTFFSFFSIITWTFMSPTFFSTLLHSSCLFWPTIYLDRDHNFKAWSIGGNRERHVVRTSSVEVAHICGVYVILILGAWYNSQPGSLGLTKLNTTTSSIYRRLWSCMNNAYGFGRYFSSLRSRWHYGFMSFYQNKSPSTLNRKGWCIG